MSACHSDNCTADATFPHPFCPHHLRMLGSETKRAIRRAQALLRSGSNPPVAKSYESVLQAAVDELVAFRVDGQERTRCTRRGCGVEIAWLITKNRKWMPVTINENLQPTDRVFDYRVHNSHIPQCRENQAAAKR